MHTFSHIQPQTSSSHSTSKSGIGDSSIILFILVIPVILVVGELLYKRRQFVKQKQQIETLERIWKLNYDDKMI